MTDLNARVILKTIVAPDFDASIAFYRDVMGGHHEIDPGVVSSPPTVEGAGDAGRTYVILQHTSADRGYLRFIEAPANADANRPPAARGWDPGFMGQECMTDDAVQSYERLTGAGHDAISRPLPYFFHNLPIPNIDVMSYAGFGPAGEEIYVTQRTRADRPAWTEPTPHTPIASAIVRCLDRGPVFAFYKQVFGLEPRVAIPCQQETTNEIMGIPSDTYFDWGGLGASSIEWQDFRLTGGVPYPTSLTKTGLASFTMEVTDLAACRTNCAEHGISIIGEGTFPLPRGSSADGFWLRGAVGELIEVVERKP